MASVVQPPSLKKRESSATREEDQLIITPLGAGNEVGRSCVYMSYKGKIVLVRFELIIISHSISEHSIQNYYCIIVNVLLLFPPSLLLDGSSIVEFTRLTLEWLLCHTLMRLTRQRLMSCSLPSMYSLRSIFPF